MIGWPARGNINAVKDSVINHQLAALRHARRLRALHPQIKQGLRRHAALLFAIFIRVDHARKKFWIRERWIAIANSDQAIAITQHARLKYKVRSKEAKRRASDEQFLIACWGHGGVGMNSHKFNGVVAAHADGGGSFFRRRCAHQSFDGGGKIGGRERCGGKETHAHGNATSVKHARSGVGCELSCAHYARSLNNAMMYWRDATIYFC